MRRHMASAARHWPGARAEDHELRVLRVFERRLCRGDSLVDTGRLRFARGRCERQRRRRYQPRDEAAPRDKFTIC